MPPIKVLHIVKSLGRGGAETLLLDTLKFHNKNNFQFTVLFFLPWKNELVNELKQQGVSVINFSASNNLKILSKILKLRTFIVKNNFKIVHCHLPWAGIVTRISLLFIHKIKLVYTEHNIQERYHYITKLFNKITFKKQNITIAVSKSVEESIYKNISKKSNCLVILNGVDTNKFIRNNTASNELKKSLNINYNKIVVGNVCVFRSQKRLKVWVDIFEKINNTNTNTIGLLVGAGILFKETEDYIIQKGLQNKIILTGLQANAQAYFNIMDVYMLTSEFEGLPIALLEAMSMQCVPAVTNAGGIKEVIDDNNGLMVAVDKVYDLSNKISEIIIHKNKMNDIVINARQTVVNRFSIEATTQSIEKLYYNLL